jgi:site-specific recombinase XerD
MHIRRYHGETSVAEAKERFFRDLGASGRSERTLTNYAEAIDQFFAHYFASDPFKDPRRVSPGDVQAYLISLRKLKRKDSTVQNRYRSLRRFFGWMTAHKLVRENPMKDVAQPRVRPLAIVPYTDGEVRAMLDATRLWPGTALRDQVIIQLLYNTGMRAGELCTLHERDVHPGAVVVTGKGKKQRWLALDGVTEDALRQYMAVRRPTKCLISLSVSGLQAVIRRLATSACVRGAHVHRFRDTLAVRFLENGGGVDDLQVLLGHSDISTTLRYVMYGREQRALAAQRKYAPFAQRAATPMT